MRDDVKLKDTATLKREHEQRQRKKLYMRYYNIGKKWRDEVKFRQYEKTWLANIGGIENAKKLLEQQNKMGFGKWLREEFTR